MSRSSPSFAASGGNVQVDIPTADDSSVATPTAGVGMKTIDQGLKEHTIRFEFQPKNSEAATKCAIIHTHLLLEIQLAFDVDVQIFNNKNVTLTKIDPIQWNSPAVHQRNYTIHGRPGTQTRKSKYIIIHRIRTNQSISTIRNYHTVSTLLKQNDCWMKSHDWDESVWDTVQGGHCLSINPSHYSPAAAADKLHRLIAEKTTIKMPPIRMVYTSPRSNSSAGPEVRSKAYAVEFARADTAVVLRALKDTFSGTRLFLMAKLRFTHPVAYANVLKMQNQHLASVYVLPLLNFTKDSLFYIEDNIRGVDGVIDIVSTRNTDTTGRYNILISKSSFKSAKAEIIDKFSNWYLAVPPDAIPHSDAFAGPARVAANGMDDESTGDQSFLSMSALSFASMDMSTGATPFESFTPTSGTYSWSQVLQTPRQVDPPIPIAVGLHTQVSDLTPSQQNSELESLKLQIASIQQVAEVQRKADQEKLNLLTKAFERQEAMMIMMQNMLKKFNPATNQPELSIQPSPNSYAQMPLTLDTSAHMDPMTQAEISPSRAPKSTDTTMQETDSFKRSQAEDETLSASSSKRRDARPSPRKQDFLQHE
jgi:hypothetical protein